MEQIKKQIAKLRSKREALFQLEDKLTEQAYQARQDSCKIGDDIYRLEVELKKLELKTQIKAKNMGLCESCRNEWFCKLHLTECSRWSPMQAVRLT